MINISKCKQKAVREDCIQKAFVNLWNKLSNYYEEILIPIITVFQAVPADSNQELKQIENQIQNIKRQSHMLQKVLSDGDIGSAIFIERKNQLELELENILQKQQMLKSHTPFEHEIIQTQKLINTFKHNAKIIEEFDENLFHQITEHITIHSDRICFTLKNGLELEEPYRKE